MIMATNKVIRKTIKDIVIESKAYIDNLFEENRLPPRGYHWRWMDEFDESYGGFAYWVPEEHKADFRLIRDHLISCREKALERTFPEVRSDLLHKVRHDPMAFKEAVSSTINGESPYASIPILHGIPVADFVDAWLEGNSENRRAVTSALDSRFRGGALERELKDEKDWALELLKELEARSEKQVGFESLRVKRLRPRVLIELTQSLKDQDADEE
jgi:hypothetical protein